MAAGMREPQCCRTCLTTDARLYNLEQYGLSKSYTSLLGYACDEDDGLPCTVCYECASRLDKFRIFRKRSRRAHAVLRGLLEENGEITSNHVRKINRTQCDLTSSLMCCNLRPVHIESKDHTLNFVQINSKSNNLEVNTTEAEIKPVGFELKWEVNSPETAVDNAHDYENLPEMKRERGSLKTEKIVPSQNKSEPKRGSTAPKSQKKVHIREKKALKRKNVTKGEENCLKSETAGEEGAKKKKRVSALTVKMENGGGNEAIDKVVAGKKKTRRGARPGARQHTMYSAEYYNNFATVTVMTEEEDQMECFNQRQYSERYKNALHSCSDCYRVFVNESAYEEHRKRHDDPSEGDKVCNICKVRRKNARALQKHIAMNHRNKFECRKCTHVCTTSLGAREHEAMHSDKKAFQCTECDLAFNRLSAYHQHTYRLHRMLAACPECGATYLDQGAVNTHRANTHGEFSNGQEVDADCKKKCECGALFYSDEAVSVHKSSHPKHAHGGTGTIHCEFCEAKFPGIKATQEHRKTHKEASAVFSQRLHPSMQELEDFECEQCGEVLSTNREYYHHFRHSHPDRVRTKYPQHCRNPGNSVMCELCGRGFQNLTSYRTHIRIDHQGEKPHKCDICNKSFKLSTSLSEHRRVHTKERPYKCSVCNKAFRHIANYQRHKSVHIDERPFGCEICEKYFKWRYALKAHIQYVHLKKPWPKRERGKCNKNTSKTESVDASME